MALEETNFVGDRTFLFFLDTGRDFYLENKLAEDYAKYTAGGYYSARLGECLGTGSRYKVLRKVGYGTFSTSWMCLDTVLKAPVVVKISKGGEFESNLMRKECENLLGISRTEGYENSRHLVKFLDSFQISCVSGSHVCLVMEALGCTLRRYVRAYEEEFDILLPMGSVKIISSQILEGLKFLHERCKLVHGDLKPDNILLRVNRRTLDILVTQGCRWARDPEKAPDFVKCSTESNTPESLFTNDIMPDEYLQELLGTLGEEESVEQYQYNVVLGDFGSAFQPSKNDGTFCFQTRQYRAPENILGLPIGYGIDVWSMGCIIFELLNGKFLFNPRMRPSFTRDRVHVLSMIQCLGKFPSSLLARVPVDRLEELMRDCGQPMWLENKPLLSHLLSDFQWDREVAETFVEFLVWVLNYDDNVRPTAAQILCHPWLSSK